MTSSHPLQPSMIPSSSPVVFPPPSPSPSPSAKAHANSPTSYTPNPPAHMSSSAHPRLYPLDPNPNSGPAARRISVASAVSARSSLSPGDTIFGSSPVGVIGRTKPREVVRIERDYSMGERCQFWSGWVWELEGRVSGVSFAGVWRGLDSGLTSPGHGCRFRLLSSRIR